MKFIDTHCHFNLSPFIDDIDNSIVHAVLAGVEHIIVPSIDARSFSCINSLAQQYNMLYAAIGLHPINVTQNYNEQLDLLETCLQNSNTNCIAIGEIGLDLYIKNEQFSNQTYLLDVQLKLAKKYDLPVILHSRLTHDILVIHLKHHDLPRRGVVHSFTGSHQQAKSFINLGYLIGVSGIITYERATKTRNTISNLPLNSLILETDAPSMPLKNFRNQPNRPERIRNIFNMLCQLRTESPQDIANSLWNNSKKLFLLPI